MSFITGVDFPTHFKKYFIHHLFILNSMFKHYFTIAWRNLGRDRSFSLLNLIGLCTGLACTLLAVL
jgi:hypothetical protein